MTSEATRQTMADYLGESFKDLDPSRVEQIAALIAKGVNKGTPRKLADILGCKPDTTTRLHLDNLLAIAIEYKGIGGEDPHVYLRDGSHRHQ